MRTSLLIVLLAACGSVQLQPDGSIQEDAAIDAQPADADPGDGKAMLSVTHVGAAGGVVLSLPKGIDCGSDCSERLPLGTFVTLTATPDAGATFGGWTGPCSGTVTTCAFTVDGDTEVSARFDVATHVVTLVTAGNGSGSITGSSGGLACPGTCSATFPYGTQLVLTATTQGGSSQFLGWSGTGCTGTTPCMLTVTDDVTITAAFGLNFTLVVTRAGNGTGTVTSSPAGIDCGSDCDQVYAANTSVTLTATPNSNSLFTGWSGGCAGAAGCTVSINAAVGVSATFTKKQYALTATVAGNGGGVIASTPSGISCPADCSEIYDHGDIITLSVTPNAQSDFTGWSGACSGTGACMVTMDQVRSVSATFTLKKFALAVTRAGTGTGTVNSTPAGITCGTDCSELYNINTMVTLTPTAASGSIFAGWSGACTGMGACAITMSATTNVTATFDPIFVYEGDVGIGGPNSTLSLGSATNRFCFLSRTLGQFGIGGGDVHVTIVGGEWVLAVTGLVTAYASCVRFSPASQILVDVPYAWTQGQGAVSMGGDTRRLCFLTRMAGKFQGGGERVWATASGGQWILGGDAGAAGLGITSGARCITWPATTPVSYSGDIGWSQGDPANNNPPTDMGPITDRFCGLTLVAGAFIGNGEYVYALPPSTRWLVGGTSQQQGVAAYARCLVAQ